MKNGGFIALLSAGVCVCASGGALGQSTNQMPDSIVTNLAPVVIEAVETKIRNLNQLVQSGTLTPQGTNQVRQLTNEIDRLGVDLSCSGGNFSVASTRRAELLAALTRLQRGYGHGFEYAVNPTPTQMLVVATVRRVRGALADNGAIPVWDVERWGDGRQLAVNNSSLPPSLMRTLVQLNLWEQNYGTVPVPAGMQGKMGDMGEATSAIEEFESQLKRAGFPVELDMALGIWKVRSPKSP